MLPRSIPNTDEVDVPGYCGNYHKGLPHRPSGLVVEKSYVAFKNALERAASSRGKDSHAFANLSKSLAASRAGLAHADRFTSPSAGLALDPLGPDPFTLPFPAAPSVTSQAAALEAVELYWMARCRDVPFVDYARSEAVAAATAELHQINSDVRYFANGAAIRPANVFRGYTLAGACRGPYVSQFLLVDVPYGAQTISQRIRTLEPAIDYGTALAEWLVLQDARVAGRVGSDRFDPTRRYLRNGRDLAQFVHGDPPLQAYANALSILLGARVPFGAGNPFVDASKELSMKGFATFGEPHVLASIGEVVSRALQAVWFQKWFVHRRLRPEAFGGLVHFALEDHPDYRGVKLDELVLASAAVQGLRARHPSALLPLAFPEGAPTHPSYGAGHASVAGACVTLLKAWFDESAEWIQPVVPSADGTELVPWGGEPLTVGGELDKLASNIAIGRNFAGLHWYSDYLESIRLGELVAIRCLAKESRLLFEDHSFSFTSFDGQTVWIGKGAIQIAGKTVLPAHLAELE